MVRVRVILGKRLLSIVVTDFEQLLVKANYINL